MDEPPAAPRSSASARRTRSDASGMTYSRDTRAFRRSAGDGALLQRGFDCRRAFILRFVRHRRKPFMRRCRLDPLRMTDARRSRRPVTKYAGMRSDFDTDRRQRVAASALMRRRRCAGNDLEPEPCSEGRPSRLPQGADRRARALAESAVRSSATVCPRRTSAERTFRANRRPGKRLGRFPRDPRRGS